MTNTLQISIFDILSPKPKEVDEVLDKYQQLLNTSLKRTKYWHKGYIYKQKYMCGVCGKFSYTTFSLVISGPTNHYWQKKDKVYYSISRWHSEGGSDGSYQKEEILRVLNNLLNKRVFVSDCGASHYLKYWRKGFQEHESWTSEVGKYLELKLKKEGKND